MPAIDKAQWMKVNLDMLGLRSGANTGDFKAASYAMDMGAKYKLGDDVPPEWEGMLDNTVTLIKGFANSSSQVLMIVRPSHGDSPEYSGCFPKCSAKPTEMIASMPIGDSSAEEMAQWVVDNIPS